jgi:hypothetical protein
MPSSRPYSVLIRQADGIDADTKLCLSYLVGGRDSGWVLDFMEDCASRIKGRVQITKDGHRAYLEAVEGAFGMDVDYAQLQENLQRSQRCRGEALFASTVREQL